MYEKIINKFFLTNLIHINRYSGSQLIKSESVSDHIWYMNSLALMVIPIINKEIGRDPTRNIAKIDGKEVIYKITIHDIDESLYCDIPRPFKYFNESIRQEIENTSQELMKTHLDADLVSQINESKGYDTRENFLVLSLDTIQVGFKMISEYKLGNSYIVTELSNVIDILYTYIKFLNNNEFDDVFNNCMTEFIIDIINLLNNYVK